MPTFTKDPHKLEELLNYCTGFAKQMIKEHGEFHSFGAVIASSGQLTAVGAHTGEEPPDAGELYLSLWHSMQSQYQKREIIACAIAANVNIPAQFHPPFPDGIRVLLECAGFSRFIYLPYQISGDSVSYGDMIPVDVKPQVFA
jgi:hypothetical protein